MVKLPNMGLPLAVSQPPRLTVWAWSAVTTMRVSSRFNRSFATCSVKQIKTKVLRPHTAIEQSETWYTKYLHNYRSRAVESNRPFSVLTRSLATCSVKREMLAMVKKLMTLSWLLWKCRLTKDKALYVPSRRRQMPRLRWWPLRPYLRDVHGLSWHLGYRK